MIYAEMKCRKIFATTASLKNPGLGQALITATIRPFSQLLYVDFQADSPDWRLVSSSEIYPVFCVLKIACPVFKGDFVTSSLSQSQVSTYSWTRQHEAIEQNLRLAEFLRQDKQKGACRRILAAHQSPLSRLHIQPAPELWWITDFLLSRKILH